MIQTRAINHLPMIIIGLAVVSSGAVGRRPPRDVIGRIKLNPDHTGAIPAACADARPRPRARRPPSTPMRYVRYDIGNFHLPPKIK
ncbi:hypothetical protein EVAR_96744_1 [Eumeta japonica]|uniref:Uncharacterized protein n=1 Tax=Eumeta variegata TaxID=151549 RepID=A0A4C1Y134_EUMVA|nr:hypothetical protein EVAR_96744_1 [Eumeta japonica]